MTLKARWHFYRRYNFSRAADWSLEDSHSPVDTFSQTVLASLIFAVCQSCSCHFIIIFFLYFTSCFHFLRFFWFVCLFVLSRITVTDPMGHNPLCGPKKMLYSLYGKKIKLLCEEGWWECQAMWDPHSPVTGSSLEGSHLPDTIFSPPPRPNWPVSPLLLWSCSCQGHSVLLDTQPLLRPHLTGQSGSFRHNWPLSPLGHTCYSSHPQNHAAWDFLLLYWLSLLKFPWLAPTSSIFSFLNWGVPKACSRPFPFLNL